MLFVEKYTSKEVDSAVWNNLVKRMGGSIFQSTAWGELSEKTRNNSKTYFLKISKPNDNLLGLVAVQLIHSNRPLIGPLKARIETDTGPLVGETAEPLKVLSSVFESFKNTALVSKLSIGSFAQAQVDSFSRIGSVYKQRIEFVVELDKSLEDIISKFSERRKRGLKKAKDLNLINLNFEEGFSECLELQNRSAERIVNRGGPNTATLSERDRLAYSDFFKSDFPRFLAAQYQGEVVGIVMISLFAGQCYYHRAYHSDEGFKLNSPVFLVAKSIEFAQQQGARIFNIGGVSASAKQEENPEHGLFQFKNSFGATQHECTSTCIRNQRLLSNLTSYLSSFLNIGR